jgi:ribosome recycling factor
MLSVQVWDKSNVGPVEKAIRSPAWASTRSTTATRCACRSRLTEERRKELAKLAGLCRKGARRDPQRAPRRHDDLKADENKKEISEDERKRGEEPRSRS